MRIGLGVTICLTVANLNLFMCIAVRDILHIGVKTQKTAACRDEPAMQERIGFLVKMHFFTVKCMIDMWSCYILSKSTV